MDSSACCFQPRVSYRDLPWQTCASTGIIIISASLISVQDYFASRSLYFTFGYVLLLSSAIFLVSLKTSKKLSVLAQPYFLVACKIICGLYTVACAILSHYRQVHSIWVLGGISLGGAILSAASFSLFPVKGKVAALPVVSSFILMMASPVHYMEIEICPWRDIYFTVAIYGSYAMILISAFAPLSDNIAFCLYLIAGTGLRALGIYQWEVDPAHRDMIPLIHFAGLSFLEGKNPYRIYWCGHDLPLTYLPGMWLSYIPAIVSGIDPRVISVILSIFSTIVMYAWGCGRTAYRDLIFLICAVWFFQIEGIWVAIFAESPPFWFFSFIFFLCILKNKKLPGSIIFGILLATRHFSFLYIPYVLIWMLGGSNSNEKIKFLSFIRVNAIYPLISMVIACMLVLPFIICDSHGFLFGTIHWLTNFGKTHKIWWNYQITFSPLFYSSGNDKWLPLIQLVGFSAIFFVGLFTGLRKKFSELFIERQQWLFLASGYTFFLLFNSLLWRHLHLMGLAIFFFAEVAWSFPLAQKETERKIENSFRNIFINKTAGSVIFILFSCLVLVSLLLIAKAFYSFFSRGKIHKDAEKVAEILKDGDLLVDDIFFNALPILEGTPFELRKFPQGVTHSFRLRNQFPPVYKRVVFATRSGNANIPGDVKDLAEYMVMNPPFRVGSIKVYVFDNPFEGVIKGKLSDNLEWIKNVVIEKDSQSILAVRNDDGFIFEEMDPRYGAKVTEMDILLSTQRCIVVDSPPGSFLKINIKIPFEGRVWLQSAISDSALWPGLKPLIFSVRKDNNKIIKIVHPDDQGFYVWHLGWFNEEEEVSMKVYSQRRKLRFFCMDIFVTAH